EIVPEDMIVEEDMVVTVSRSGYVKRNPVSLYRSQRRGGKGIKGMGTKEEDFVEQLFVASTHDHMLFFTNTGRCHWLKVHELPQAGRASRGKAAVNLLQLQPGETLTATLPIRRFEPERYLLMATRKGIIKKTPLSAFSNPRSGGIRAMLLDEGDELIAVRQTDGDREAFLASRQGKAIRFHEREVRPMGRAARGVRGIRLAKGDEVIGMVVISPGNTILTATERGFGKRTEVESYRKTRRGGRGIINLKVTERTGPVVGIRQVYIDDEFMLISGEGQVIRSKVKDVPSYSRAAQGVKLMNLEEGDRVAAVARLEEEGEGNEGNGKD
ncbi:MAG: DNA gyrase C-terminal beta-propeller domain-containing protein, partial [Nitrospinota bacterium]